MLHRKIKSYRISIYFGKIICDFLYYSHKPFHDQWNTGTWQTMQCPHQSLCIKQYYIWVQTSKPSAHSKNPHCFCLGSGQAKNFLPLLGPSFITVLNAAGLPWFGQIGNFSSAHWNTPKSKISCFWYNSLRYIQENVWNKCHNNLNIL